MAGVKKPMGRPRKADQYAGQIASAERIIADRLPSLLVNMMTLADGVTVQEVTLDGLRVYTRPPDRQANEYLINRILGKPTECREITGEDGEPLGVEIDRLSIALLAELADDPAARTKVSRALIKMIPNAPSGDAGETTGPESDDGGSGVIPGPVAEASVDVAVEAALASLLPTVGQVDDHGGQGAPDGD
jgi:hypothetical protein